MKRLAVAFLLFASTAWADQAVVVGVNQYPNLHNADLRGCVNDAELMASRLKGNGFQVRKIANGSRKEILDAVAATGKNLKAEERFVFYFSGHGSGPENPSLVTSSSLPQNISGDITASELNETIKGFRCKSRTVLLDSCFSGAMMKGAFPTDWASRYYARDGSKDLVMVKQSDQPATGTIEGVCYFVASRANEVSIEAPIGNSRHGVFTYYLDQRLGAGSATWGDLQSQVSADVVQFLDDRQHPTLSQRFQGISVFGGTGQSGEYTNQSLWQIFNTDSVNVKMLRLTMIPNQTQVKVGQNLGFKIQCGASGYLVIAERGTSGRVNLIYPLEGTLDAARIGSTRTIQIPDEGQAWAPDAAGRERLRAFLFKSPEAAGEMLRALVSNKGIDMKALGQEMSNTRVTSRDLKIVGPASTGQQYQFPYYTSDVHFVVTK